MVGHSSESEGFLMLQIESKIAATHEYCVIRLHVPIDYENISTVNFASSAGWLAACC